MKNFVLTIIASVEPGNPGHKKGRWVGGDLSEKYYDHGFQWGYEYQRGSKKKKKHWDLTAVNYYQQTIYNFI